MMPRKGSSCHPLLFTSLLGDLRQAAFLSALVCNYEDKNPGLPYRTEHPLGVLLRSLLHAVQRPGRSPSFLFQPQRFGRDTRASPSSGSRIIPRAWDLMAPQFLSMAAPQRFGKKK
uniref:Neuropeptide FF-amide peptide precursor n=1 Tax=Varanus komodoensis TaxID=61221 RepID=A0A8D2J3H8_VARKO